MMWDAESIAAVNLALNEADVAAVRLDRAGSTCDVLLHVVALPAEGPLDRDPRRILRLLSPRRLRFLLRTDRTSTAGYGPAIPIADLDAVEALFASWQWSDAMYGWKFLDDATLTEDWPTQTSLTVEVDGPEPAQPHTFYWFAECGREEDGEARAYCFEGTIEFADLQVLRADGTSEPLDEFAADGKRYWAALQAREPRLSVEAQRVAAQIAPRWR